MAVSPAVPSFSADLRKLAGGQRPDFRSFGVMGRGIAMQGGGHTCQVATPPAQARGTLQATPPCSPTASGDTIPFRRGAKT